MTAAQAETLVSERSTDFVLTNTEFTRIRELVREHTGIALSEAKRQLIYGRLSRRLRALGLQSFSEYLVLLERGERGEIEEFTNAVTTNLTAFFREDHHFQYLASQGLAQMLARQADGRRIRIWSCACSTGEEPYSIAMVLQEQRPAWQGYDVRILATDLDSNVLATAAAGVYAPDRLKAMTRPRVTRFFQRGVGSRAGQVRVDPALRELIRFGQLNLMNQWPMRGPFDAVFCRNVVIYFDKPTQRILFERIAQVQRPGDLLFLGHSESLHGVTDKYDLIGHTIYRRAER